MDTETSSLFLATDTDADCGLTEATRTEAGVATTGGESTAGACFFVTFTA